MRSLSLLLAIAIHAPSAAQDSLEGEAARLYGQAHKAGRRFSEAERLKPEVLPTSDGRSFLVVWSTVRSPSRWIVSLHGSRGFATEDLAVWSPHLKGREVGIVCLQWWMGSGDGTRDYYTPSEAYREIDAALQRRGVKPGSVLLHGFSRGSANSYAVAALDAGKGRRYFSLIVAHAGGVGLDYPPTRDLVDGRYGERPLKGSRWITVAGARDPNPERDGIAGMRRTASWLEDQGAVVVERIEDPDEGHGAMHRNSRNARRVLDLFFR